MPDKTPQACPLGDKGHLQAMSENAYAHLRFDHPDTTTQPPQEPEQMFHNVGIGKDYATPTQPPEDLHNNRVSQNESHKISPDIVYPDKDQRDYRRTDLITAAYANTGHAIDIETIERLEYYVLALIARTNRESRIEELLWVAAMLRDVGTDPHDWREKVDEHLAALESQTNNGEEG